MANTPTQILPVDLNSNVPAVMIMFDDGLDAVYDEAFAYMQTKGMKGTAYIPTVYIDAQTGWMTSAQLQEMDAAGWDIANHTTDHTGLTDYNQAVQQAHLAGAKAALDGWGLTRASAHVAYPWGAYNAATLAAMAAEGMLTGRTIVEKMATIPEMAANWYVMPGVNVDRFDSLAGIKAIVDDTMRLGKVTILYFHNLVASSPGANEWLISDFRALIDYIYSNRLPTLTITQLYALHSAELEYTNYWYS